MPFLRKLKSKLYSRRAEEALAEREKKREKPELEQLVTPKDRSMLFTSELKRQEKRRKAFIIAGVFLVLIVVGVIVFLLVQAWQSHKSVKASQIKLEVLAPESIVSGSKVTYSINYGNLSKVDWKEVEIIITYPGGFTFSESSIPPASEEENTRFVLGRVKKGEQSSFTVQGVIIGDPEKPAVLKAEISLMPENFHSRFSKDAYATVKIEPLPIDFTIEVPQFASSGEQIRYVVSYQNKSSLALNDVSIVFTYPSGFSPTSFEPSPSKENHIWQYTSIGPTASGQIVVTGNLSGQPAEAKSVSVAFITKTAKGETVTLRQISGQTEITKRALVVETLLNNKSEINVRPEELVRATINFRNDGNLGIGNLVLKAKIEGEGIDLETLKINDGGRFDSGKREIVWIASGAPILENLAAGKGGSVSFSFEVPKKIEANTLQDKNFKVDITATIDSPEIPAPPGGVKEIQSSVATAKVISVMVLEASTYYDDGRAGITSTGPLPPKVGQETTYTIYWRLYNTTNDLKNAKVEGLLPSGVSCTGKSFVTYGADIVCDERSGKVVWDLGSVSAHTGFLLPQAEAAFQVAITPGPPDINRTVTLIQESKASGIDLFTGESLESKVGRKTTGDASEINQGRVVP